MHVHSSWLGAFQSCEEAIPKCLKAQPKALAHFFFQTGSWVHCCPEMSLLENEVITPQNKATAGEEGMKEPMLLLSSGQVVGLKCSS